MQDLCSTDPTQESCPRSCRLRLPPCNVSQIPQIIRIRNISALWKIYRSWTVSGNWWSIRCVLVCLLLNRDLTFRARPCFGRSVCFVHRFIIPWGKKTKQTNQGGDDHVLVGKKEIPQLNASSCKPIELGASTLGGCVCSASSSVKRRTCWRSATKTIDTNPNQTTNAPTYRMRRVCVIPPLGRFSKLDCSATKRVPTPDDTSSERSRRDAFQRRAFWAPVAQL